MSKTVVLNKVNIGAVGELVEAIKNKPETAQTTWSADVRWKKGFQSEATIANGRYGPFLSDEPKQLGGEAKAPNPVEQLIASLGNCLAVGYAANATLRGIKLDEVKIHLEGDIDLRTFLGLAQGNAGYEKISAQVEITSDAPQKDLEELHKAVVATSPVGHTLSRAVPVDIQLAGAA